MRCFVALAVALSGVAQASERIVGDERLAIVFEDDGRMREIRAGGTPLVVAWDGEFSFKAEGCGIEPCGERMVRTWARGRDWLVETTYEIFPDARAVRKSYRFEWLGEEPGKLKGMNVHHGLLKGTGSDDVFFVPGVFPPKRLVREKSIGVAMTATAGPNVAISKSGEWTLTQLLDESRPYSDRGNSKSEPRNEGFALSTYFESAGHVRKGRPQEIGDVWLVFRRGSLDEALQAVPTWFDLVGQKIPDDRPDWAKRAIIYSYHPTGGRENWFRDFTGLTGSERHLERLRDLGVNVIWLRPLEDGSIYKPDDYYAFNTNYATSASLLSYVRKAHGLGLKVWRDAVPHGGNSDSRRGREHPEWLGWNEDGTIPDYRAFDLNAPGWVRYFSDWIEYDTRKHKLDGWRIDVPHGLRYPNWNPGIPYARASFAQNQGGLSIQRAIRAAMRRANPDAVDLAESNHSLHSTCSDMIYDQYICHFHYLRFRNRDAGEMVADFRQWLYEQQLVFVPDTIHLRYPESHDSMRAALLYGRPCATAMMAMCAWIRGVPLLYQEEEDEAFDDFRRILRIRAALDELNDGTADYLAVRAPSGVFACLREKGDLRSVAFVNFNPVRTRGMATVETTGEAVALDLPPFGFDVVRLSGGPVPKEIWNAAPYATVLPKRLMPVAEVGNRSVRLPMTASDGTVIEAVAEALFHRNLEPYPEPIELVAEKTAEGYRVRVTDMKGGDPAGVELAIRFPRPAGRWFARTAEGLFEGPYVERHPVTGRLPCGCRRSPVPGGVDADGVRFFDSRLHPFRPDSDRWSSAGFAYGDFAVQVSGFEQGAAVYVGHGLGTRSVGPTVSVCGPYPKGSLRTLECKVSLVPAAVSFPNEKVPEDDYPVKTIAGGWRYERGGLRVEIGRGGDLRGIWQVWDGKTVQLAANGEWKADFLADGKRKMYYQTEEFETAQRFFDDGCGRIALEFEKGVLTPLDGRMKDKCPVVYTVRYVFDGSKTFRLESEIVNTAKRTDPKARVFFALSTPENALEVKGGESCEGLRKFRNDPVSVWDVSENLQVVGSTLLKLSVTPGPEIGSKVKSSVSEAGHLWE